jgi:hypothetical protein
MRSLLTTVTIIAATIALSGCPSVPGPQSSAAAALHFGVGSANARPQGHPQAAVGPSEINWFQGTLDEAFARPPCP